MKVKPLFPSTEVTISSYAEVVGKAFQIFLIAISSCTERGHWLLADGATATWTHCLNAALDRRGVAFTALSNVSS